MMSSNNAQGLDAIDTFAHALKALTETARAHPPKAVLAALGVLKIGVEQELTLGAHPSPPALPGPRKKPGPKPRSVDDNWEAAQDRDDQKTRGEISHANGWKKARVTNFVNWLRSIEKLGEGAPLGALSREWMLDPPSAAYRLRQLKKAELAAKVGPEKGAGPWKWTGKAVEWMEKHAR